ncbi:MAG: hypothetical protein ABIQ95_06625 [Bdellovibrionia bacterium]
MKTPFVLVLLVLSACGSPGYDSTNTIANSMLIFGTVEQVNVSLSSQACNAALAQILPLYDSVNTNNQIRLATAASYGCAAKVNIFQVLSDMTKASNLGGSGLWKFLAGEFPSVASPDDKMPTAAGLGTDAAMAAVGDGTLIVPTVKINATSHNPGSLILGDRITDANSYITFLSMSLMGSLLYRDGRPNATTLVKTVPLPWQTAPTAVGNGCAFAAALLNFFDGLDAITGASPATIQASYKVISSFLTTGVNTACGLGCSLICGGASTCTSCPTTLRDRNSCTGLTTDANSCAAAGLAAFVSSSWI